MNYVPIILSFTLHLLLLFPSSHRSDEKNSALSLSLSLSGCFADLHSFGSSSASTGFADRVGSRAPEPRHTDLRERFQTPLELLA